MVVYRLCFPRIIEGGTMVHLNSLYVAMDMPVVLRRNGHACGFMSRWTRLWFYVATDTPVVLCLDRHAAARVVWDDCRVLQALHLKCLPQLTVMQRLHDTTQAQRKPSTTLVS
jgi:hypothetical protein